MLVQDYSFAVQSLATACELYVKHFGELAIECGEVYFLYGKALFRLSQQQAGVLGGALNEGMFIFKLFKKKKRNSRNSIYFLMVLKNILVYTYSGL